MSGWSTGSSAQLGDPIWMIETTSPYHGTKRRVITSKQGLASAVKALEFGNRHLMDGYHFEVYVCTGPSWENADRYGNTVENVDA